MVLNQSVTHINRKLIIFHTLFQVSLNFLQEFSIKLFFCSSCWLSSRLLFSRSLHHHILWLHLSFSNWVAYVYIVKQINCILFHQIHIIVFWWSHSFSSWFSSNIHSIKLFHKISSVWLLWCHLCLSDIRSCTHFQNLCLDIIDIFCFGFSLGGFCESI